MRELHDVLFRGVFLVIEFALIDDGERVVAASDLLSGKMPQWFDE